MKTTKLELQQLLATRNAELEAARMRIAELEGDVAALKAQGLAIQQLLNEAVARETALEATLKRSAGTPRSARPAYVAPPATAEALAYRAALAAAKEMAMRTGRSVRVGA